MRGAHDRRRARRVRGARDGRGAPRYAGRARRGGDAANILSFGQESLQFSLVGETVGAAGLLANLACFVGDRRCSCLRNTTNSDRGESNQFSREVGRIIAGCFTSNPSRNLSGISQEAALNICG